MKRPRVRKPGKLVQLILGILFLIYVAHYGIPFTDDTPPVPAPQAYATSDYPPGVTNCEVGITPEAADQLTELQLFNSRAWVMRECDGIPIPDITQATLDCEHTIADQYPDQTGHEKEIYDRQLGCPDEPANALPNGVIWRQR